MRRKTAVGLLCTVAGPALLAGAASGLLRLQAGRLRRAFAAAADAQDAPGTRMVSEPPAFLTDTAEPPLTGGSATDDSLDASAEGSPTAGSAAEDSPAAALAVLGDSWIAGSAPGDPARLLSRGLAALLSTPVHLSAFAEPSARAEALITQVDRALADPHLRTRGGPRIAVISMGTADIVFPVTGSITLGVLSSALTRLDRAGFAVVVLCCPNLSSLPGIRNPLRTVLRRSSRVLAGSQWLAALAAGALPLSVTRILSGTSHAGLVDPSGQRPSPLGRRQLAAAVLHEIAQRYALPQYSHPMEDE
ncbi:G-D-S-L family lipolytic protein [Brevibacterium jeotgali]|uniref:GDSL-like Lipase/Acylhydrolase family protein n=1 Tax=Brevibacterium jeotgali TaxID=1262550 RepID=A0A2H1L663_9MICO|nr:G-D-S-L family lipolytic protein [Brevibacterium jeotgali]TWC03537.1 hypothetical protein FB108_2268 [Brevibacterium jeotgali]SMY12359.1 hypothetical protein BJEO58_01953 [Brevibacterium jeotgali]